MGAHGDQAHGARRVAVVTGAGQGIGRAIARALAQAGCRVAVVDRNEDRAAAAAAELGGDALAIVADVSLQRDVAEMAETVSALMGRWDVLVNNAGALKLGDLRSTSVADWDAVFDGCVKTAWLCSRAAAPQMRAAGGGRIVNICSVVAQGAESHGLIAYTAAKAAVAGLTIAAARELGEHGITVNAVSPGAVETDAWAKFPDPDGLRAKRAAVTLMRRLAAPSEIGAAVAYLASEQAGFVTGQTLVVDGGRTDKL